MQIGFFLGYAQNGSEVVLTPPELLSGVIFKGVRCKRIVRNLVGQLAKSNERVLILCLFEPLANDFDGWLPNIGPEELAGAIFTYEQTNDRYPTTLASCLSFGLALDDNSEYIVRDVIKELASASTAGGPVAITSMLLEQGGEQAFWTKKRLEELLAVNYITPYKFPEYCLASLWRIPPVNVRVAIALACACKFIVREGGYAVFLGWNLVTSIANRSPSLRSRLRQLLAEVQNSGAHVIALQTDPAGEDPKNQPFGISITEQGPFFVLHGKQTAIDVRFAAPDLVISNAANQLERKSVKSDMIMVVLEAVRKYPNSTLTGLFTFLKPELDEAELELAIREAFEGGYVKMEESRTKGEKTVVLTKSGRKLLDSGGV
jgi:hypothetical protein